MSIPTAQLEAKHRNKTLGSLWHILDPLMTVAVWWLMFGVILNINRGVDNLVGFLAVGAFVFHYTSGSVKLGARALVQNEGLIRSILFPRAILPLAAVISALLGLGYAFFAMFGIVLITGEEPSWTWLALFPIVALQSLLNAGLGLAFARVGDRFKDFLQVLPFGLRIWGMLSGIFVPIAPRLQDHPPLLAITKLNPAYLYMEMSRSAILDNQWPVAREWITIAVWGVLGLIAGFLFFIAREQEYGRG